MRDVWKYALLESGAVSALMDPTKYLPLLADSLVVDQVSTSSITVIKPQLGYRSHVVINYTRSSYISITTGRKILIMTKPYSDIRVFVITYTIVMVIGIQNLHE